MAKAMGHVRKDGIEEQAAQILKSQDRRPLTLARTVRPDIAANLATQTISPPEHGKRESRGELAAEIHLAYDSLGLICTTRLPIRALEP